MSLHIDKFSKNKLAVVSGKPNMSYSISKTPEGVFTIGERHVSHKEFRILNSVNNIVMIISNSGKIYSMR